MTEATFEQQMMHLFREYNKAYKENEDIENEILVWLENARNGDAEAETKIIYYISGFIYSKASSLLRSKDISAIDVWDLFQAGIVAVVKTAIPNFAPGTATFKTYALNCAEFKMKNEIGRLLDAGVVGRPKMNAKDISNAKKEKEFTIQSVDKMMEDAGDQAQKEISDACAECEEIKNPETIVMANIESEKIKELINQLSEDERRVVNMHIYQGDKSFKEIADELDMFDFKVEDIYTDAVNKLTELIRK